MTGAKLRINPIVASLMIGLALVYDLFKFLLSFIFMGWIVTIWSRSTFWFWFAFSGVSFMTPSKLQGAKIASMGVPAIIGMLPVISALPGETLGVVTTISIAYSEDMLENVTPEALGVMGKVLTKFKKRSKGDGLQTEKSEVAPTQNVNKSIIPPYPDTDRKSKTNQEKEEVNRNISEKKVTMQRERTRPDFDGIRNNIDKETGMRDSTQKVPPKQPQYQEFDQKSGRLIPTQIEREDSDDWPIAI